jgi:hypothetical protein
LSRAVLEDALSAIDEYIGGGGDIGDLQARLAADASALDRTYSGVVDELRGLDADLEEIRFARLLDEQRPAAVFRLESARESVAAALRNCPE